MPHDVNDGQAAGDADGPEVFRFSFAAAAACDDVHSARDGMSSRVLRWDEAGGRSDRPVDVARALRAIADGWMLPS